MKCYFPSFFFSNFKNKEFSTIIIFCKLCILSFAKLITESPIAIFSMDIFEADGTKWLNCPFVVMRFLETHQILIALKIANLVLKMMSCLIIRYMLLLRKLSFLFIICLMYVKRITHSTWDQGGTRHWLQSILFLMYTYFFIEIVIVLY